MGDAERFVRLGELAAVCAAAETDEDLRRAFELTVRLLDGRVAHLYRPNGAGLVAERVLPAHPGGPPAEERFAHGHPALAEPTGDDAIRLAGDDADAHGLLEGALGQALLAPFGARDEVLLRLGPPPASCWLGVGLAEVGDRDVLLRRAAIVRPLLAEAAGWVRTRRQEQAFAAAASELLERRGRLVLVPDGRGHLHALDGRCLDDGGAPVAAGLIRALDAILARTEWGSDGQGTEISIPGGDDSSIRARVLPAAAGTSGAVVVERPRPPLSAADLCRQGLAGRQAEVLSLILAGDTTAAVGHRLGISSKTVQKHLEQAYRRLGATNRLDALSHLLEAV